MAAPDHAQRPSRDFACTRRGVHTWLCLTLAAVLGLVTSGNLFQLALAWIATSLCLHQLLVFYPDRPKAQLAARKKFLISRLGDLCLVGALVLIYGAFGSLDLPAIASAARQLQQSGADQTLLHAAAALIVASALLKSAQFPFHGWLPEVMETPTPVSALLHAGIINAGGFLILRLSDVVALSTPALDALAIVGGFTALFGSVVMLTQTSVKVSLAWSTIAQMGFMLLQCGLGAYAAAMLHIVAHALYKAHAFLASGSIIDLARASWAPAPSGRPHPLRLAAVLAGAGVLSVAMGTLFGASLTETPGVFVLGFILLMGLAQLIDASLGAQPSLRVAAGGLALAVAVAVAYFALQLGAEHLLAAALPANQALRGPLDLAIVGLTVLSFASVTVLQSLLPFRAAEPRWQSLYVHLANGLYLNALANRLTLRLWPAPQRTLNQGAKA
ncbi:proton-conducting transporter membrane subunit [uncultured Methylobacterium sp.]|uniref:proton-conducting transporter transmembrane domain-containing protein n=1 Tax=uncultured Methylobacterium sp. TaxID=157278 RepID=UPI00259496E0|nr:proton-conducting transporter membrane subunit [uncultured Methylobacterium sp.]